MTVVSDHTSVLEELIAATSGGLGDACAALGLRRAAPALVDELVSRCEAPAIDDGVEIHLRIAFHTERVDYVVRFGDRTVAAEPGVPGSPWARLDFDLADLASTLFGRRSPTAPALWRHEALKVPTADTSPEEVRELLKIQAGAMRANDALLAACDSRQPSLNQLATRFATDKWGMVHWYTPYYEHHFGRFADEPIRLLEIGIGGYHDLESGGASLRMWQQYFRRGIIYGLDIYEKRIATPRIRTIQGDQGDPAFLRDMAEQIGPFDIIVDDGSHLNKHVLTSFTTLFPYLRVGGIYAIEDLQTSYWPGWGGNLPDRAGATSSLGFLKGLIDGLHYREYGRAVSYFDENVVSLHFYHNLAYVVKGPNDEVGTPVAVRDHPPAYIPVGEDDLG
jgi:demethylmacrocin O-methyltransferase